MELLAAMLVRNRTLQILNLSVFLSTHFFVFCIITNHNTQWCMINEAGGCSLAAALHMNDTLRELNLEVCESIYIFVNTILSVF